MRFVYNLNGHFKNGEMFSGQEALESFAKLFLSRPREGDDWAHLSTMALRDRCPFCDAMRRQDVKIEKDGDTVHVTIPTPCPNPTGHTISWYDLAVPSGELIIANDLRYCFPGAGSYDVNRPIGIMQTIHAYASKGMIHGFCGNSCPPIRRTRTAYVIASNPSGWYTEWFRNADGKSDYTTHRVPITKRFYGKSLGSICTDLWWYSVCDASELKHRCEVLGLDYNEIYNDTYTTKLKVRPGTYRFTCNSYIPEIECAGVPAVYCKFWWVYDCDAYDPQKSEVHRFLTQDVSAERYLAQSLKNWPTLFMYHETREVAGMKFSGRMVPWEEQTQEQRAISIAKAADHCLCTLGNGESWHPNGFPIGNIDEDIVPVEIPPFAFKHAWYPLSERYTPMIRANLNTSFAKLSFNVVQSILTYGVEPLQRGDTGERTVQEAKKVYQHLRTKYPHLVDPAFDGNVGLWQDHEYVTIGAGG